MEEEEAPLFPSSLALGNTLCYCFSMDRSDGGGEIVEKDRYLNPSRSPPPNDPPTVTESEET